MWDVGCGRNQISTDSICILPPPTSHLPHPPSMCGRFGLTRPEALKLERFGITELPPLVPRYNIPPSSDVLVVRERKGVTEAEMIRWGLVPSWAKDPSIGNRMANVRSRSEEHTSELQSPC